MPKKIFIAGSATPEMSTRAFNQLAKSIANALYKSEFELIITTTGKSKELDESYHTFDQLALKTYSKNETNVKPKVHYYESSQFNPFKHPRDYINIEFVRKKIEGTKQRVIMNAIADADCILLLGGRTTVELIGQLATLLSKPMIPIPWLGGSSQRLWEEHRSMYNLDFASFLDNSNHFADQTPKNFDSLLIKYIKEVNNDNPFIKEKKMSLRSGIILLLTVLLSLCGWTWLFSTGFKAEEYHLTTAFALGCVPLSVLLGTILRLGSFQHIRIFLIDVSKSLILAFGLVLLYIYAGYLATGEIIDLEPEDFQRVAINLSLIGLLAGYLMNSAESILQEKLISFLRKETDFKNNDQK